MTSTKLIHIVAPGMPYDPGELKKSVGIIKGWGLNFVQPPGLLKKDHPICSSRRDSRWQHLQEALLSEESSIIWAVRGGYGSLHLIPFLQKIKKPKKPKLFIGFSDNTTLHQFFNQQWHWPTWHGPHLDRLYKLSSANLSQIKKLLTGKKPLQIFSHLKPLNQKAKSTKVLRAKIIGGNLITLQSSLATQNQLNCQKRILFIEDIGERGYRIDRVLEHFQQAGIFKGITAMIVGPFVGGLEPNGKDLSKKVLQEFAERQKFPIFSGVTSGHILNSQILPLETAAILQKKSSSFQLSVSTGWSLNGDGAFE
ncbi:LD-carboxypeptidase [bacterium]|nr:LD-carboxypeptidase [bacterium]